MRQLATRRPSGEVNSGVGDVLIRVEGVGKRFCRDLRKSLVYGVQDIVSDLIGRDRSEAALRSKEFWANQGVSFELRRGECLGLVGGNGAGKTTLLKMLNGLIKPDVGRIEMRGRVGALIALGAGFNPILTGRENVYVAGSVLGFSKQEISDRYGEIVEFAELSEFMETPVQNYSSGMQVRLGFAIASSMEPDILLVDEVLAVGDSAFKLRCYNRIRVLLPKTAVILVSHSMFDISRSCNRVLVLNKGEALFGGNVADGIHVYNSLCRPKVPDSKSDLSIHKDNMVLSVEVEEFSASHDNLNTGLKVSLKVLCAQTIGLVRLRFVIYDEGQHGIAEWDSKLHEITHQLNKGWNDICQEVYPIRLKSGNYRVVLNISDMDNRGYYVGIQDGLWLEVENASVAGAAYKI